MKEIDVYKRQAFKHRKLNIFFHHSDARANLVAYLILFGRNAECLGALYSSVVDVYKRQRELCLYIVFSPPIVTVSVFYNTPNGSVCACLLYTSRCV